MYEFDSFFTLTQWERVGLIALSLFLALICAAIVWMVSRGLIWPLRIVVALVVTWGFVWVSPQGYYAYYRMIFDDLPAQWVIPDFPTVGDMWGHLTFSGRTTLSSHSKGLLGWALIVLALLRRKRECRNAAN